MPVYEKYAITSTSMSPMWCMQTNDMLHDSVELLGAVAGNILLFGSDVKYI